MASERKEKLVSLRLTLSDFCYLRSTSIERNISLSEFVRIIIEKYRKIYGEKELTLSEVSAYLKKLTDLERDDLLDKVESSRKRKFSSLIKDIFNQNPNIKGKELCRVVSEELNMPITLDFKRKVLLRLKSLKRRKNLVEKLEKETR